LTPSDRDIAKMFYIVKGHITDKKTMEDSYDGYFKRMWGNHEICYHEDGFEEAYEAYQKKSKVDRL
tara:strand:+ start:24 stop:221 length:198 start_codon:yes stop_codon:yes gene_type:complete